MKIDYQTMGTKIRQKRKELGLTQEKVSEKLDLSESFYSRIERGERVLSLETLMKIAGFYNLSLDYLLLNTVRSGIADVQAELDDIFSSVNPSQKPYLMRLLRVHAKNIDNLLP